MSGNARRWDSPDAPHQRPAPFTLAAQLERQHAEFARTGPTMADILADLDRFRSDGVPGEDVATSVQESRQDRQEHLERLWRQ